MMFGDVRRLLRPPGRLWLGIASARIPAGALGRRHAMEILTYHFDELFLTSCQFPARI